ncbi:hypothetical protein [Pedobacter sp. NJ-S-72]
MMNGRIRVDDLEMDETVQAEVNKLWAGVTTDSLPELGDLAGYKHDFLNLFGFDVAGVDYEVESDEMKQVPGLV